MRCSAEDVFQTLSVATRTEKGACATDAAVFFFFFFFPAQSAKAAKVTVVKSHDDQPNKTANKS